MSESVSREQVQQLWNQTVDELKQGEVNLQLWAAMEACVPLALEDDALVLGIKAEDYHRSGTLNAPGAAHQIREILAKLAGKPLRLEIVSGTELRHWEEEKERRAHREQRARQSLDRRKADHDRELKSWDDVSSELQRLYSAIKEKNLPWMLVQYMREAFAVIAQVEAQQRDDAGTDEHNMNRGLARVLNRLGDQISMPLTSLALEYVRHKETEHDGQVGA